MNIIEQIEAEVIRRYNSPSNIFGAESWHYHTKQVVKKAIVLAEQHNADVEIVTLGALLHDIAAITDEKYVENHHIIGAEIADELLTKLNYPKERIEHVKQCVLNHRGSKPAEKLTIEEVCVADADALAHFDNIPSLFCMVYKERGMSIAEGEQWLKSKLERSYAKLSNASKEQNKQKYEHAMSIFSSSRKDEVYQ